MKPQVKGLDSAEALFVGIDLHKVSWHVTIRTADVELFSGSVPGRWEVLRMLLQRYRDSSHTGGLRGRLFRFLAA